MSPSLEQDMSDLELEAAEGRHKHPVLLGHLYEPEDGPYTAPICAEDDNFVLEGGHLPGWEITTRVLSSVVKIGSSQAGSAYRSFFCSK